ncbi:hypothetical protein HDU82_004859 [Entophlyctis luteolus]|nr:hypothetical protein HDU82_004859 [Entophlyctis luteolus]
MPDQPAKSTSATSAYKPVRLALHHLTLCSTNPERLSDFYKRVLGFCHAPRPLASSSGRWLELKAATMNFVLQITDANLDPALRDQTKSGHARLAFSTGSINEITNLLENLQVNYSTTTGGAQKSINQIVFEDCDGNSIEVNNLTPKRDDADSEPNPQPPLQVPLPNSIDWENPRFYTRLGVVDRSKALQIAIIGGSIGGLATAHALLKVGCFVTVFERGSRDRRRGGGGVAISDASKAVLESLSIFSASSDSRELLSPMRYHVDYSPSGFILRKGVIPFYSSHWIQLYNKLLDTLPSDCVRFDNEFVDAEDLGKGKGVRFYINDKSEKEEGELEEYESDILIGADGNMSRVRDLVFKPTSEYVRDAGYRSWRGQLDLNSKNEIDFVDPLKDSYPPHEFHVQLMRHSHVVLFYMPGNICNWQLFINKPNPNPDLRIRKTDVGTKRNKLTKPALPQDLDHLHEFVRAFSPDRTLEKLIIASSKTTVQSLVIDHEPLVSFHNGSNVVLVGDAAHAATPHLTRGSNMAFQDAYWLARTFAENKGERDGWFERYDLRVDDCRRIVELSKRVGRVRQGLGIDDSSEENMWDFDSMDVDQFEIACGDGISGMRIE